LHILNGGDASFTANTTYDALVVENGTSAQGTALQLVAATNGVSSIGFSDSTRSVGQITYDHSGDYLFINTAGVERFRLDSSGRLLVGTSSSRSGWFNSGTWGNPTLQVEGTSVFSSGISVTNNSNDDNGSQIILGKSRATSVGGVTVVSSGDNLGRISFQGADGTELVAGATIEAVVDGSPGANNLPSKLVFSTTASGASSPTDRLTISSSGHLLSGLSSALTNFYIGNTANTPRVQVQGSTNSTSTLALFSSSTSGMGRLHLATGSSGNNPALNDGTGAIHFSGYDGTNYRNTASIQSAIDATPGSGDMPGRLVFLTTADGAASPTEGMRMDNQRGLFTYTNQDPGLTVSSQRGSGTTDRILQGRHSATGINTGTLCFQVFTNGNVQNTNNSYGIISDAKVKENIVDASSQWSDIKNIRIRNFNLKEETGHETHRQIGVVAQEVEKVSPGLVYETRDRDEKGNDLGTVTKGVHTSVLYMKAVKALQEAIERIEQLEAKVAALEAS